MNLRIGFKIFQKTDSFSKRLQTATNANTDRNDDEKKGKKRKKTAENKKTRVASGAVSKDRKVNTAPSVSNFDQHRTDGAPMHKFMHKFMHACIKSIKIKYTNSKKNA